MNKVIHFKSKTTQMEVQRLETRKTINALASMLTDLDQAIAATKRISGNSTINNIYTQLIVVREKAVSEITIVKARYESLRNLA